MNEYYQAGNTIKLKGRFSDFEDSNLIIPPDQVNLKIYNASWKLIDNIQVNDQDQEGYYVYFYVFDEVGTYYYEWFGVFEGLPSLERKRIKIKRV